MLSKDRYYGGATEFDFTVASEVLQLYDTTYRLWHFTATVEVTPYVGVSLPDARTLQRGHPIYYFVNETGHDLRVYTYDEETLLTTVPNGFIIGMSLYSNTTASGSWVGRARSFALTPQFEPTLLASFGTMTGAGQEVFSYALLSDAWTTRTSMPAGGNDVSAGSIRDGAFAKTFWLSGNVFYEFGPGIGHVAKTAPGGTTPSNRPLMGASEKLMYVDAPGPANTARIYTHGADSWATAAAALPTALTEGSGAESLSTDNGDVWFLSGAPGSQRNFTSYTILTETATAERIPVGSGFYAAGLGSVVGTPFVFGGTLSTGGGVSSSTSVAQQYRFSSSSWITIPGMPLAGRGQGVCELRGSPGKVFVGMGLWNETTPTTPRMYQYSVSTQDYTVKGTTAWGDADRRENAWANLKVSL